MFITIKLGSDKDIEEKTQIYANLVNQLPSCYKEIIIELANSVKLVLDNKGNLFINNIIFHFIYFVKRIE